MQTIQLVREFHEIFDHSVADKPQLPTNKETKFRFNFMKEELDETLEAFIEEDLVAFADGLGDLQYVLDGWFLNAGLHHKKEAILTEIHRSNMTKACKSEGEAEKTIARLLLAEEPVIAHWEKHGEYWVVYRTSDRKVMKSINYQPPNLKAILDMV